MIRFRDSAQWPKVLLALVIGLAAACGSAAAQTHRRAASPKPRVTETTIQFAITDESGKLVDTSHASGRASFPSGGLKGRATLRPEAPNRICASGSPLGFGMELL